MTVQVMAVVEVSSRLERAFKVFPEIVNEETMEAMEDGTRILDTAVKEQIRAEGLVKSGTLLNEVRRSVTGQSFTTATGRVGIGFPGRSKAFYAKFHEKGAIIEPKKGDYLTFPIGDVVLIDRVGDKQLKRAKREFINARWVKIRRVVVPATHFFTKAVERGMPPVEARFEVAAERALERSFGKG